MALPTISEILGQPTSAAQSTTPMGTAFDISQGAQQVFQAAQIQQQADWQRYGQFTKNLQDAIGDVNKISELEVAPEDRPAIMEKTAEVLKKMKDNLGAMANPMADPAAYAALKKEGADAYSLAIKSKQRHAYDIATRAYMAQNPEWATPENKQILQSSFSTPLEAWQPYQLGNPMPAFDINKLAADANTFAENPNFMEVIGEVGGKDPKTGAYTKGNEWIASREGTVYDEGKFTDKWGSYYNYADKNGVNTIKDWTKTFIYDQLGKEEKARLDKTGDPLKAAWMEYGKNLRGKDKLGEKLTKSTEWETKYEQSQQNRRAAMSARGGGDDNPPSTVSGNAFDSMPDYRFPGGTYVKDGKVYKNDGTPYSGKIGFPKKAISDEIVSVIASGNPNYFGKSTSGSGGGYPFGGGGGSDSGQVVFDDMEADVVDGVIQGARFRSGGKMLQTVGRGAIENYQIGQSSKFVEKGMPTPTYGGGRSTNIKPPLE